jgi:threonine efflux protein
LALYTHFTEGANDRLVCCCDDFSVYAAGVVIPGPNFVAVVHNAVSGRRSDTLALVAGIVTVNLFWATCAISGIGMVFAIFPWLAVGVRRAGAAYLI